METDKNQCEFVEPKLVDLKWVSVLPSQSKFGMEDANPIVQCRITIQTESFNIDFTQNGISDLNNELQKIQETLQNFK